MQNVYRMRDGAGNEYDVPENDMLEFSGMVKDATKVTRYSDRDGNRYDVPQSDYAEFRGAVPNAQPMYRIKFDNGTTREFSVHEYANFLRSKEWLEGDDYRSDREARDAAIEERDARHEAEMAVQAGGGSLKMQKTGFWPNATDAMADAGGTAIGRTIGGIISKPVKMAGLLSSWLRADSLGSIGTMTVKDPASISSKMQDDPILNFGKKIDEWTDILFPEGPRTDNKFAQLWGKGVGLGAGIMEFRATPTGLLAGGHFADGFVAAHDAAKARGATEEEAMGIASTRGAIDAAITTAFKNAPVHRLAAQFGYKSTPAVLDAIKKAGEKGIYGVTKTSDATAVGKQMLGNAVASATEMGALGGLQAYLDNVVMQEAETGNVDWDKALEVFKESALDQATFGAIMALLPTGVKVREAVKQRDAYLKTSLGDPNGIIAYAYANPEAGDMLAQAWRKEGKISRRVAREAGLPELDESTRNGIGETIASFNDRKAGWARVRLDEVQSKALDESIAGVVGGEEKAPAIREKVLENLTDARDLDDPAKREALIAKAVEEIAPAGDDGVARTKVGTRAEEDAAAQARYEANRAANQKPEPPAEEPAVKPDGKGKMVPVEPQTPVEEAKRPEVAADAPQEPAETRPVAETGKETPEPAKPMEAPSSASDAKPVPDGKGKMVKPKAAEGDYGVTMFEEPSVDGDGVWYVVKDGKSDAHRRMYKSREKAEAVLSEERAFRKAIMESPSATLADGKKIRLLKTDEGWVPYDEHYNDLTQGMFKAAKTKAEAIKIAEKGVKWAKGVAEENARYEAEAAKPKAENPAQPAETTKPDGKGKMVKPATQKKPVKANPKKAAKVTEEFVSKDKTRASLQSVFHDHENGVAVASDGRVLIATKHGYDPNAKMNPEITFPNWKQIVPDYSKGSYEHIEHVVENGKPSLQKTWLDVQEAEVDPAAISSACKKASALANKIKHSGTVFVRFELPDGKVMVFDGANLRKVADAMAANGITKVKAIGPGAPILAKNADTTIVAMPFKSGSVDLAPGRGGAHFVIDARTGRVLSAPERSDNVAMFSREWADDLRRQIAKGKAETVDFVRKSDLFKGVLDAVKRGETDAKTVYEGIPGGNNWEKLSQSNKDAFAEWLKIKDENALAERMAEHLADSNLHMPKYSWRKKLPSELEKIEKRIAAEDEIDSLMSDAPIASKKSTKPSDRLESRALDGDLPDLFSTAKNEKAKLQRIEPIASEPSKSPEQEVAERLDLKRLDPKRRSDPKVLKWAKKNGRNVTNGMVTPDAVRAYDEAMTEATAKKARRWFPDMKIVAHKFGETIKRGVHVIEQRRAPREDPIVSNILERLKFGKNYDPNNSHHIAYSSSRDEIALFHDKGNGEYDIIERTRASEENHARLKARIESYRAEESTASIDAGIQEIEGARGRGGLDRGNGTQNRRAGSRHGDLALEDKGDGRAEAARQGEGDSGSVSYLRDTSGGVIGWFDPRSKEVHLLPGADPKTVAHEIMWHGTRDYITQLVAKGDARAQKFLDMMHDVEQNAPQAIKDLVNRLYARGGQAISRDTLLNEYGAWFTMKKGGEALEQALQTDAGRNWFARGLYTVKEMYKDFLTAHGKNRVDLSAIDGMTRDEFVDFLAKDFSSGKTLGNIKGKQPPTLSTKETALQKYKRRVYDQNAAVRDLERDIEKKTGRKISVDDSVEAANALKYGLKEAANRATQGEMREFRKVLFETGISPADFEYYAALKAAAGRDAKIDARNIAKLTADLRSQGASAQDIADAVANYKSSNGSHIDPREARMMLDEIEHGPDAAKFKKAYDAIRQIIDATLDTQVKAGLVGSAEAAQWRKEEPFYIPFKNEYDAETGEWAGRGMSRNFSKPEHYTAKGRQSAAGDILAHIFMDHQAAKIRAIENGVRQKLANLVRANPELGKVEVLGKNETGIEANNPNVVVFKEGGRSYKITLEGTRGEAIANAFTQRNQLKMGWADRKFWILPSFRGFTRGTAALATRWSPFFAIRNTTKDNIELANIIYSERGPIEGSKFMGRYIASRSQMAGTLFKYITTGKIDTTNAHGKILDRYIKAGGLIAGGTQGEAFDSIKKSLTPEAIAKEMRRGMSKARAVEKHIRNSISYLNEYAEMATRVSIFAAEIKSGKSDAEAALFSRRATVDFNRHGDWTPGFNLFRLFSNSTLGATARAAAALGKSKYGKSYAAAMFANGLIRVFIDHFVNADEDEQRRKAGKATGKDISEYERRTSLFYFRNGDKLYKVAQHESPFSLFSYAGDCVGRWICGDLDGKQVAKNLGVATAEVAYNFLPMGSINLTAENGGFAEDVKAALVSGVVPSQAQPLAELAANIDYAGRTIYNEPYHDDMTPRAEQGRDSTPDWAKEVAVGLNEATRSEGKRSGYVDIPPEAIQKLVEGYGKNALRDVSMAVGIGEAVIKGDFSKYDPRNTPVKRDFVRPLDGNDKRFVAASKKFRENKDYFKKMSADMTPSEKSAYVEKFPHVRDERGDKLLKEIARIRKMERGFGVRNGKFVPHEWSQEKLDEFKENRRRLQAQFLELMGDE